MLIVCPNCATSYDIDMASLRPNGRRVRCVRCRSVWQAELPHKDKLLAAADALAPGQPAVDAAAEVAAGSAAGGLAPPPTEVGSAGVTDNPPAAAAAEHRNAAAEARSPAVAPAGADELAAAQDMPVEVESPPTAPGEAEEDALPIDIDAAGEPADDELPEDIESVAARRFANRRRVRWQWPLSHLQTAIVALIVLDAIVIGWRGDFVRAMPQTASFYAWLGLPVNVRGLDFDGLATTTEEHDGVPILVVHGNIVNVTGKIETVPHLRFAVRNAARQEIYSWSAVPPQNVVAGGQAVAFQTRLASPPPDSHDVLVRFVNRYDVLAGTR